MGVVLFLIRPHHKLGQLVHKTKYLILVKHRFKEKCKGSPETIKPSSSFDLFDYLGVS